MVGGMRQMKHLNIFESIGRTTGRIEPIHSQFLADALGASLREDRSLFNAVWERIAPKGWDTPDEAHVKAEEPVGQGRRIDICICDKARQHVVGIEIKTSDDSVTSNQLHTYLKGLRAKDEYANYDIAIGYITPFNRQRAGDQADFLLAVKEFDEFSEAFKEVHATHLSWLDIADIAWDGTELWKQHQSYVLCHISSDGKLAEASSNRALEEFFGEDTVARFWAHLSTVGVPRRGDGVQLDLSRMDADPLVRALPEALELLIGDEHTSRAARRKDKFELRQLYVDSQYGAWHKALFDLADRFPHVWLQGEVDYGVRVAHEQHSGGVSLVRSRGLHRLEFGKRR